MRVIHVLRKPLSEGTVAANTLKHGCGGINIDASRVKGGPSSGGSISGASALGQGSGWNAHANRTTQIDRSMSSGRWPANVILQHLDGCLCAGIKKAPNEVYGKWDHFHPSNHADEEGNETVAHWACEPGCPVVRLDEQSGERKTTWVSPTHKNNRDSDFMGALNHPGHQGYNDTGGASRFYKQVGGSGETT